ncbi:hypothetical protein [Flagellimonas sp. 2504JD1-5]
MKNISRFFLCRYINALFELINGGAKKGIAQKLWETTNRKVRMNLIEQIKSNMVSH